MHETWFDPTSRYQATGWVRGGRMTDAEVIDSNGFTRERDRTFASKQEFYSWARKDSGMS